MKYFIAHDLGTSGTKSSLFSKEGELIKSVINSYEADFRGREATQNPDLLLNAVISGSRELSKVVDPADILAMSFSAQMNACLLVDETGKPLHDTFIWADTRADKQAGQLVDALGFDHIYNLTGNRPSENYSLYKLMWIRDNQPDIYKRAYKMLQPKDYVSYHLTGVMVTDHSDASGTGVYDLTKGCWSDELIKASGIREDLLPRIIRSIDPVGNLLPEMAKKMGLAQSTMVIAGGGDGPCATVGAGCVENNQFYLTFGTSAWFGGTTDKPVLDSEHALFCFAHVMPNKYMPLGTMQSAGSSYAYIRKLFEDENISYADYDQLVSSVEIGSEGLLFLPYLIGERSPIWNPHASAAFIGVRPYHSKAHYVRSVLEGVGFNLEMILQRFRLTKQIDELVITGGGAKSATTRQILADILNANLLVPQNVQESTSIAAALIAGIGCGEYQDFTPLDKFLRIEETTGKQIKKVQIYNKYKPLFAESYQALKSVMQELDELKY